MHDDEEDARGYRKNFVASRDRSPARWDEEPLPYSERYAASIHAQQRFRLGSSGIDIKQAVGTSGQGLNRLGDLLWRRKPGYTAVD
eukprot:14946-Heterococcus_DN1.PRE.1